MRMWTRLMRRVAKKIKIHAIFMFLLIILWQYKKAWTSRRFPPPPRNLQCFREIFFLFFRKHLWIVGKWEFSKILPEQPCTIQCLYCTLPWLWLKALEFYLQTKIISNNISAGYAYSMSGWQHFSKNSFSLLHVNLALSKCPSRRLRIFYARYCTKKREENTLEG